MNEQPSLRSGLQHRVYWITKRIAQGQFATPERAATLQLQGITHVLNVGEGASIVSAADFGFAEIRDCPIVDLERIPDELAIAAIDTLHEMLLVPDSRVFIHCLAGQNRSPTILWLYFISCGIAPEDARELICEHSPDAVPGHSLLVDERLVAAVKSHGAMTYLPLPDPSILEPAY